MQTHLGPVVSLLSFKIVYAEQHPEVVMQSIEGTEGQQVSAANIGREVGSQIRHASHNASPLSYWLSPRRALNKLAAPIWRAFSSRAARWACSAIRLANTSALLSAVICAWT